MLDKAQIEKKITDLEANLPKMIEQANRTVSNVEGQIIAWKQMLATCELTLVKDPEKEETA